MPTPVESVETIPVGLPFRHPYATATGTLDRREMVIVRIRSADGTTGYGDAVPMTLRGGRNLDAVKADIERICAPLVIGLEIDSSPSLAIGEAARSWCAAGSGAQAASGVSIALLDLAGKLHGQPVWSLLGADAHVPVRCNGTIGADPPDAAAAAASDLVAAGFRTVKVKVGKDRDADRIEAVRSACGSGVKLRIDANGAWDVSQAIDRLEELAPLRIELAEQPCASAEGLAAVRRATSVPIVADESITDRESAIEALAIGAMDAATLKLAKVGGVESALAISSAAPSYLSSALDSALGIAAAAHTVQALEPRQFAVGLEHGLATSSLFTDNVADDELLRGPSISLTDRPGLGIEVDEAAIERLRIG